MKSIKKNVNFTVSGDNSSLWGKSGGTYNITEFEVNYINWIAHPPKSGDTLFASVNVFGKEISSNEDVSWEQYTDNKISKQINSNEKIKKIIYNMVYKQLKRNGIEQPMPENINIDWSEQGLQPTTGWNFDVYFKN